MLAQRKLMTLIIPAVRETSQVNCQGARMILRNAKLAAQTIMTVVVTAMLLGSLVVSVARAQDGAARRSQDPGSDRRYEAPIGARQPRPQDLPPDVLRDEGHVRPSERDFDKSLEICRPC